MYYFAVQDYGKLAISDDDTLLPDGNHRYLLPVEIKGKCVATFSGMKGITKAQRLCLSQFSNQIQLGDNDRINVRDLFLCWLELLTDSAIPREMLFLPKRFRIDLNLYLLLVQVTGLQPFDMVEQAVHGCHPSLVLSCPSNYSVLDQIRKNNQHCIRLVNFIVNTLDDCSKPIQVVPTISDPMRWNCDQKSIHTCYHCKQFHLARNYSSNSLDFYPREFVVDYCRDTDKFSICPYYPNVDYDKLFDKTIGNYGFRIETLTFEDLFNASNQWNNIGSSSNSSNQVRQPYELMVLTRSVEDGNSLSIISKGGISGRRYTIDLLNN